MNQLECQVTSCQHYCDNRCCLPGIHVDGPAARESGETCCASYEERHSGAGENLSSQGSPSLDSSIQCQAQHCAYNKDCKCEAECVCIGCCCGDVTSKSGTECCTFQNK